MSLTEKGKGLWYNIHMKRKRGEKMRKKGEKGAPTPDQMARAKGEAVSPEQQAAIAMDMKKKGKKPKVNELSMSARDIKKSGLRKTTDTDKLKKELEQLKKLLKQKKISVETFMSRRPGNQMSDLYKLYTLAIKAMPGSQKQKELKKRIAALRKELKLDEKVEYVEYKFKNRNDAMKAKAYFDGIQLMNFDVNDDGASQGKLAVDANSKDMTKYHKEVMKKFRPKVMTQEKLDEKLGKDADAGDYIDDFKKSDAPQFKGKSDKKKKDMAIAAYLDAKEKGKVKEDVPANNTGSIPNPADTVMGPKKKKSHTLTIHDKRYKKSLMGQSQPVLLKRFRDYYDAKGIGG